MAMRGGELPPQHIVLFILVLCTPLIYSADSSSCATSLSASSAFNSTSLDVENLCPTATLYYQCTISVLDPNAALEFSVQAAFVKGTYSVLPLCHISSSSGSVFNSSGATQLSQQGAIDPCWSPTNFTGWSIGFVVSDLQNQSGILWNFTIAQSPSLELNTSNVLYDFFAVNHTYPIDLRSIELHHHSINLNLELTGPSEAFLPQVVLSTNPCAALSHSAERFLFLNQTATMHSALLGGLLSKRYYLTFTRDLRVPFPPSGQLLLTPVADPTGAPPRPFYFQLWFIGAVGIGLLVLLMIVVTRAAVAQTYQDYANLKI